MRVILQASIMLTLELKPISASEKFLFVSLYLFFLFLEKSNLIAKKIFFIYPKMLMAFVLITII